MKVRYDEGLASRIALESCAYYREVIGEGLTEVRAGQPLSREMMNLSGCRRFCTCGRPHGGARYASALTPGAVVDPGMYVTLLTEAGRSPTWPVGGNVNRSASGR